MDVGGWVGGWVVGGGGGGGRVSGGGVRGGGGGGTNGIHASRVRSSIKLNSAARFSGA